MSQPFLTRLGTILFRVRSIAPVAVLFVVMRSIWKGHEVQAPGDAILNLVGLALVILGALIRFVTIGLIPRGTSLQSRKIQASQLNTRGPYQVCRHPLYLGNYFITFGLLAIVHEPWAWLFGSLYVVVSQTLIAHAEDAMLREKFGAEFEAWKREVPAFLPRVWKLGEVRGTFAWKRALQREVNPFVAWGSGVTLLFLWEEFTQGRLSLEEGRRFLWVQAALLVLLIANKVWKKVSPA
ncbi:MAG: methyltransferase family protein [Archangium sp.]